MLLRLLTAMASLALAAVSTGCAGPGSYVWFSAMPAEDSSGEYLINAGDVINVRVLGHEDMLTKARVRADGRIAVPIIGEVEARGKRPSALRAEIEGRLKDFLVMPSVTVNVDESLPVSIAVLGEVTHPGVFPIDPSMSLAQVLALSGGVTDFASRDRIFVIRSSPKPERIRFTYEAVVRNESRADGFRLHPGDFVVVE